jgi:regulator of replication initiation timing
LELQKEVEKRDEQIQKLKAETQKLKRELDSKTKTCESLQAEKKNLDHSLKAVIKEKASGNDDQKRQVELQQMVQDLEIQLQSRDADLNKLKVEAESLAGENVS